MEKKKISLWPSGLTLFIFLVCAIIAWFDPTDRSTHLRFYLYGAGCVSATAGLIMRIREKNRTNSDGRQNTEEDC